MTIRRGGKRSAASLSVVSVLNEARPAPPNELTEEEATEWREIAARLPHDWFVRENYPLLMEYCRHIIRARDLAGDIVKFKRFPDEVRETTEWVEHYDRLLRMADRERAAIVNLATKMRLTQQSRYLEKKAANLTKVSTGPKKIWDTRQLTRGQRNCDWIEIVCRIPEGKHVGHPLVLRPWQKRIIKGIYNKPTRRAIISFGRKNGKTSLAACLLLLHLCGPEARPNSQLYSAATSRDQASVIFNLAAKMVRLSPYMQNEIIIRESAKQLLFPERGTMYRALSAEASTAYGLSPVFIVHDELGQVKGPRSELFEALETATGAQEDPLSIVISTQAPTDADLLSVLIDDAKAEGDPRVRLFIYTSDPEADAFDKKTIKQANPAFGDFQNATEVLAQAEDARRMPSRESEYRNLILNQRVETNNPFISKGVWLENGGPVIGDFAGLKLYGGLDLSETSDLTALVLIAAHEGKWHVRPTFWLPEEGLLERARKDRVPYDVWHKQGFLQTTPGRSIEYEWVAEHLRGLFDKLDIRQVGFDRWNWRHFKPWLQKAGFSEKELERFIEFGQGYASMSPALRDLESDLLAQKFAHGNHAVLMDNAANAVVTKDPAGNRKLDKAKSRGRIDGMVALVMARGVAATEDLETAAYSLHFV